MWLTHRPIANSTILWIQSSSTGRSKRQTSFCSLWHNSHSLHRWYHAPRTATYSPLVRIHEWKFARFAPQLRVVAPLRTVLRARCHVDSMAKGSRGSLTILGFGELIRGPCRMRLQAVNTYVHGEPWFNASGTLASAYIDAECCGSGHSLGLTALLFHACVF